jgi:glycerol-3-phosphate acyltransferase PlsY
MLLYYILLLLATYFFGSFPSGFLVVKYGAGKNIMDYGTGNVGTMNTHRSTGNKFLTILTFSGDLIKGALSFYVAEWFVTEFSIERWIALSIAFFGVILGHNYTVWLKFKGGKGLAAGAGFFLVFNPWLFVAWVVGFFIVVLISKYMVLGQMLATIGVVIYTGIIHPDQFWIVLPGGLLVILKHYPRMKKVLDGSEPKLYYKEKGKK